MKAVKIVGLITIVLLSLIVLGSLLFGARWIGLEWRGYWSKQEQNVEREVFEETRSYRHGKIQALTRYRSQYYRTNDQSEKDLIASTVRMEFAEFDIDSLDQQSLKDFWNECNNR